jgi:hypothetical protein
MAFKYRKSIDESLAVGKDFPLNSTYAATAKAGDVVMLSGGEVVLATTGATAVLGVVQGFTFEGVGVTPKVVKVQIDADALYEADKVGSGALTIGTAYGIDGASNLDTADTSVTVAKIVEVVNGKPYVMITARQLF